MAGCCFQLFGSLKMTFDGEEVAPGFTGGKARLLAYLILSFDRPQSRKQIAFDFWPDSTEKQALSNFRKLLHDLRVSLPQIDRYLNITSTSIQWTDDLPFCSDVRDFEQAALGQTLHELRKAEQLYKGELLPGFYDEWLGAKRELLAQTYLNVLDKIIAILIGQREYSAALLYANKLLASNHSREETYRTLMRLHALNKDKASIVQAYRQLHKVLQEEFGIGPTEETSQLLEALIQNSTEHSVAADSPMPLIGRIAEWGSLRTAWKQATVDRNGLLLLKGEAGIGKTRLALEFKAWVESHGGQTALAGCYPSLRSLSYTPVAAWLRSVPLPQLGPARLSELSRLLPELHERYPDLPKPNPILESWQQNNWYEAMEQMLLAKQPLLLVLDDMQWSDGETLQLLSYLLRGDSNAKLLVVATMRTDEPPGDAVEQVIRDLRTERKLTEIDLAPLGEEETRQMMVSAVGDALTDRHFSGLYAGTGGNPLFIVETLREWVHMGGDNDFRLSPMVNAVIQNRLGKLSPNQRRLVTAIAAVGRPVSAAFAAKLSHTGEEAALEQLEQLAHVKVLQETGNGEYDFTHDIVKETAYKLSNESRRRQCHGQIARCLSAFHHGQLETFAAEIAFHYELSGMAQKAVAYYEVAAVAAEKIYANETRIKYYRKICALLPPEQILPVLMKLGDALIIAGDLSEAERTYRSWLENFGYSVSLHERSLCDVGLGNCLRIQGKYAEAKFYLERALSRFKLLEDSAGLSLVYGTLGSLYYFSSNYQSLYYLLERMEMLDGNHRTRDDCRFIGFIGFLYYDQCEYDVAIQWFKRQTRLAVEIREPHFVGEAMGGLALVYFETGDTDQAFDHIIEKMEISKSIGARMAFAMAIGMMGKYYQLLGAREQAEQCFAFCLEESVLIKDMHIAAVVLGMAGCNLMAQCRYEEAGGRIAYSLRLSRHIHNPLFECDALYFMSLLRHRQNQCESAVEAAEEALLIAGRQKRREMQASLLVHLIDLKTGMGRITSAEAMDQLKRMMAQYSGQQERAAISFAMWKLEPESEEHRDLARMLNEALYRKSGKEEYLIRCREMHGSPELAAVRLMPRIAAEATHNKRISPDIFAEIDRYMKS